MDNTHPEYQEILKLRAYIEELNHAYYNLDDPLVSDFEYDELLQRLEELEADYPEYAEDSSPTRVVGGEASGDLPRVEHKIPMLSLQDVFSLDEVRAFTYGVRRQYPDVVFSVEEKIDGLSINLRYKHGKFELAHTRGDGIHYGENVSENVKRLVNLPLEVNTTVPEMHLRAEVYMSYEDFLKSNAEQEILGLKTFANPRNTAAGTMRQLNPDVVEQRGLRYFVFDLLYIEGQASASDKENLEWLRSLGFSVIPEVKLCYTDEEVAEVISHINDRRSKLDYGIDGAVIKVDQAHIREELGTTSKVPRWAVAYKYPPEVKETKLTDIHVQVGRTGKLTPLAILEPVLLSGSTISRASLHNGAIISALDVRPGDTVQVSKSGDIIPQIIAVNKDKRNLESEVWTMPQTCPVCNSTVKAELDSVDLFCTNISCPAQVSRKIIYFASKNAMDIDGLGAQTVETLFDEGYLHTIADIYHLHTYKDELIENGIVGREKRVNRLFKAIEESKENDLWRLICGFGIRHIGPQTARNLANHFKNLENLSRADRQELLNVADIGRESAESLILFFSEKNNLELIKVLREEGLNFTVNESDSEIIDTTHPLFNKVVVLTGTLSSYSRSEAKTLLENKGAVVRSSVSSKTDFVVYGEEPGSKIDKAKKLGVTLVSERQFELLLQGEL